MEDFVAISSETKFEEAEDHLIDLKRIKWYSVKMRVFETDQERKEKLEAMRRQYDLGVIQANGLPTGIRPEQVGLPPQKPQKEPQRAWSNQQLRSMHSAQNQPQIQAMKQQRHAKISNSEIAKKFGL